MVCFCCLICFSWRAEGQFYAAADRLANILRSIFVSLSTIVLNDSVVNARTIVLSRV
jgi:hypothetical protein